MEPVKRDRSYAPSFSELLDEFFLKELRPVGGRWNGGSPSVNICETENDFVLEMAAPGMSKGDFNIEVTPGNQLVISSESKQEKEEKGEDGRRFTMREFSYSSFRRSFNLPDSVDSNKIDATYKDGVLEITIPKRPESKPKPARMIEIK